MSIRVLDQQALGRGGGVELLVGGDQGDGSSPSGLKGPVGFECSGELQSDGSIPSFNNPTKRRAEVSHA